MSPEGIEHQARKEYEQEEYRKMVEDVKERLRKRKTLRQLLFPFRITIERID